MKGRSRQKRPAISSWQIYAVHNALRYKIHSNQSHILRFSLVFCRLFSRLSLFCCAWVWFRWFFFSAGVCAITHAITLLRLLLRVCLCSAYQCATKRRKNIHTDYWINLNNTNRNGEFTHTDMNWFSEERKNTKLNYSSFACCNRGTESVEIQFNAVVERHCKTIAKVGVDSESADSYRVDRRVFTTASYHIIASLMFIWSTIFSFKWRTEPFSAIHTFL